jgi:hypothetical protein
MLSGFPAAYFGIAAFAETDVTEDLKTIDCEPACNSDQVRGEIGVQN